MHFFLAERQKLINDVAFWRSQVNLLYVMTRRVGNPWTEEDAVSSVLRPGRVLNRASVEKKRGLNGLPKVIPINIVWFTQKNKIILSNKCILSCVEGGVWLSFKNLLRIGESLSISFTLLSEPAKKPSLLKMTRSSTLEL